MASKVEIMQEMDRRGMLPPNQKAVFDEMINRGLIGTGDTTTATGGFLDTMSSEQELPQPGEISRTASQLYRPTLEGGGMIAGGILGTGVNPGLGTLAGAGLLYSIGSNIADRLDELLGLKDSMTLMESSEKAATDIVKGAAFEAGGRATAQAIVYGGKGLIAASEKIGLGNFFRKMKSLFPKMSDRAMLLKAKKILKEAREETALAQKEGKETERVFKRFGVKETPTHGQKTGDVKASSFEQSVSAKNAELKEILLMKDAKIQQQALEGFEKEFIGIPGEIDDVVTGVAKHQAGLKSVADKAAGTVSDDVARLQAGRKVQQVGQDTQQSLAGIKKIEKAKVTAKYDEIPPDILLDGDILKSTTKSLIADFKKIGGGKKSFPRDIVRQIRTILKNAKDTKGEITFESLRDLRSQTSQEIRESFMSRDPNLKLIRRLEMLKKGLDESLDQMLELGGRDAQASNLYRQASKMYVDYLAKTKSGVVGDVLQAGRQASGYKVGYSDVPARFFRTGKMDAADDLVRAMGKKEAAKAIDDYAAADLLSRGDLTPKLVDKWLRSNKDVLNKYGLYNKYANVAKNQNVLDFARNKVDEFGKTVASKVIGVDIDQVVKSVFSGKASTRGIRTAHELLNLPGIKGNPAAINGIQKAFKDFYKASIQSSGVDRLGNPVQTVAKADQFLKKYGSAMNVIFKNRPKQLRAFYDYHKLLKVLQRNKNVTYSGGSTTTEKLSGDTARSIGRNLAQFVAVSKGGGWKFSALKNLFGAIAGAPRRLSQKKIDTLLTEAIYNPEVADMIMTAAKSKVPAKLVQKKLRGSLISLGIYQYNREE